jgi:hypothetical protein
MKAPRLLLVLVACATAGCVSGGPEGSGPVAVDPVQKSQTAAPAATEAASPSRRTYSFCKDRLNEGGAIDLAGAQVQRNGGLLNVTWNLTDSPPEAGTALYSVTIVPDDGTGTRQYGVKYEGGRQVAYFVFDSATGKQQNVKDDAYLYDGDLQAANFPLNGLTDSFRYSVTATVDGEDVERCPDADGELVTYDGP